MKTEHGSDSKPSWPEKVVRKWLNLPTGINHQFDSTTADKNSTIIATPQETRVHHHHVHSLTRRKSCSDKNDVFLIHDDFRGTSDNLRRNRIRSEGSAVTYAAGGQNHRMFVGTWNVGGRSPHDRLNLRDWLCTPAPSDIYVLGFQEIVPLNAGNVLGSKDRIPAATWICLIRQALNFPKRSSNLNDRHSHPSDTSTSQHPDQFPKPRVSFSDLISVDDDHVDEEFRCYCDEEDDNGDEWESPSTNPNSSDDDFAEVSPIERSCQRPWKRGHVSSGYRLAASKQMVGIFLCVWIRGDLSPQLSRVKASCVARGVMGCMGNKGSISISMTLRETTFCFVCTHLTSGEKEKDEIKRNSDVVEILKRTRFRHSRRSRSSGPNPKTILEHDKIIWLGDLNYRLTSSCEETHKLLNKNDWKSLLEMDQLRIEQKAGRIFEGWEEGQIYFPPTYKYLTNSDCYAAHTDAKPKHKRRTPAWCDRILWRGEGMKQICYVRGESKFSDHRPVYSIFSVHVADTSEVETTATSTLTSNKNDSRATTTTTTTLWSILNGGGDDNGRWPLEGTQTATTSNNSDANTCGGVDSKISFPIARTQSCIETPRFRHE